MTQANLIVTYGEDKVSILGSGKPVDIVNELGRLRKEIIERYAPNAEEMTQAMDAFEGVLEPIMCETEDHLEPVYKCLSYLSRALDSVLAYQRADHAQIAALYERLAQRDAPERGCSVPTCRCQNR